MTVYEPSSMRASRSEHEHLEPPRVPLMRNDARSLSEIRRAYIDYVERTGQRPDYIILTQAEYAEVAAMLGGGYPVMLVGLSIVVIP